MRYPVAIEAGTAREAYGVVVPDIPGCYSAGDTLDDAMSNAEDAILLGLEAYAERGEAFPEPSTIAEIVKRDPGLARWMWALVTVDETQLRGPAERINITVPRHALLRIDEAAREARESRSAFLVNSALRRSAELTSKVRETAAPVYRTRVAKLSSSAKSAAGKRVSPVSRKRLAKRK